MAKPTTTDVPSPEERERAAWALLNAQIAAARRAATWEPWKAIAAIIAAAAVMTAAVVALSNWRAGPQPIIVEVRSPMHVQVDK
jgi:hypothetical protein